MFKDNLKRLREEAKYTQEELARKLFVSRSAVAKWEQGRGIPKEETIEDIAKIFNVPISSFYGENEPQKVIEKIEKKSRLNLLITIVVSILIIVLSIVIYNNKYKYKIEYDKFFSEKTLKEFGLEYLRPITLNLKGSININDSYRVDIDSYAVFEEYVNYLFNYFKDNPNIAYYGFEVTKPIEGSTLLDFKTYILKSDNLEDYKTSIHLDYNNQKQIDYTFYYLTNIPKKRNVGDAIDFNYIKISYQHEIGSWIKVKDIEYKLNTNLIIRSTKR
jgi:transcriptional regulator with XRE-family HTH domain